MAITSVVLDIKTNTERALNDFKRFSSQLDNKFLVSGLKLDVVRSALGQINREFQKAIGEQGLQSGQSLRAAQNQAALLTQTFKGFSAGASADMAQQFSTAFSQIAVVAGGTAQDIQKALAATPFISTNLPEDMRRALGKGVLDFQKDFRRAGLSEDFGGIAKQFLSGGISAKALMESKDAGQASLGGQLIKSNGAIDTITNAEDRTRAFYTAIQDPAFVKTISEMAKRTYGFKAVIEDLNSTLFNPEAGVFGSLRQVTMAIGDKTTVFDETKALVDSVFGRQGVFVNFFKQIGKIFGLEDPLKAIIIGIRFVTRQFDKLNKFIQSPEIQEIVKKIQEVFNVIKNFFTQLYNQVTSDFSDPTSLIGQVKQIGLDIGGFFEQLYKTISTGGWDPASAVADIKKVGQAARKFIEQIGKSFRDMDVEKQGSLFLEIFKTMVAEVAQTLGTAIKEAILSVFSGKGAAVFAGVLTTLYEGLSKFFAGLFGGNQGAGAVLGGAAMAALGVLFVRRIRGALESILAPINAMRRGGGGAGGFINRLLGGGRGDRNLEGGRMGFQAQVIARMDAIIRILGGYAGPSSPLEDGNTDPRRGRRGGGGSGGDDGGGVDSDGGRRRGGSRSRRVRGRTQYSGSIGPLPRGSAEPWTWADESFQPYMDADRSDARGRSTSQRFNSRYGSGGRRALMGRGLGRMGRGLGKGALILGGIGLAGAAIFGGGVAQAGQIDQATGLPVPLTPQQEAQKAKQDQANAGVGSVLSGGFEGAMIGATIGSIVPGIGTAAGAVIGGVIGGVVPLLDKGTRDGVGTFTAGWMNSLQKAGKSIQDFAGRGVNFIKEGFEGIGKWFSQIDWKSALIAALVPGGNMTIQGLQGISAFASKLGIFDGIKAGIDAISSTATSILSGDWLPKALGGKREAGGTVIKGSSYIVGERGPEIFTPGASGSISTNRDLMAMRSGGGGSISASFNIAINVNGGMAAGDVEALRAPVLRIVEEAWASATQGTVSRGVVA